MKVLVVFVLVFATGVLSDEIRGRILGGQDANPTNFKYQARVFVPSAYDWSRISQCGGSVIHNNWILTAAHCFDKGDKKRTFVVMGLKRDNEYTKKRDALRVIMHSRYYHDQFNVLNDIALIRIPFVKFDTYTQSIPLSNMASLDNQVVTVAGWGLTGPNSSPTKMQYTTFNVLNTNECKQKLGRHFPSTQLCTLATSKNTCAGDSGGPAVIGFDKTAKQVGLVSYGITDCSPNSPAAYTRISSYLPWLRSITGIRF